MKQRWHSLEPSRESVRDFDRRTLDRLICHLHRKFPPEFLREVFLSRSIYPFEPNVQGNLMKIIDIHRRHLLQLDKHSDWFDCFQRRLSLSVAQFPNSNQKRKMNGLNFDSSWNLPEILISHVISYSFRILMVESPKNVSNRSLKEKSFPSNHLHLQLSLDLLSASNWTNRHVVEWHRTLPKRPLIRSIEAQKNKQSSVNVRESVHLFDWKFSSNIQKLDLVDKLKWKRNSVPMSDLFDSFYPSLKIRNKWMN